MPHASQDLLALRQRAALRGGVASREDLGDCGFSPRAAERRVDAGEWSRVGRAILLSPDASRLSDTAWSWVLRLTYGEKARISGHLAMRQAGWSLPHETRVVVLPHQSKSAIPGVVVLRRPDGSAVLNLDGTRFTRVHEAFVDALVVLGPGPAEALLDVALQRRFVTPDVLATSVSPRLGKGHRGAAHLRVLVDRALSGSRSEAEQRMGALLRRSDTGPWRMNLPVRDSRGRVVAEIDFAHEGLRVAIEVDGRAHHSDRRAFERDRARQNQLVLMGWLVLRFTWEQITEQPELVIATVRQAIVGRQRALAGPAGAS